MSTSTKSKIKTNNAPISPFLVKLVELLENSDNQQYIRWNGISKSFTVLNQEAFSKHILPKYFKHSDFSSFVRQLKLYGFGKKPLSSLTFRLAQHKEKVGDVHVFFSRNSDPKDQTKVNGAPIPCFLLKLVDMLENSDNEQYVRWSADGKSFIVLNQERFTNHVLRKYFRHTQFTSFVRQLNFYGFRKIVSLVRLEEQAEFKHSFFIRGKANLLPLIQRTSKVSNSKQAEGVAAVPNEVVEIKDNQSELTRILSNMKQKNLDLRREVVSLRQKHAQLQKVVNHLIPCFAGEQDRETSRKRRLPIQWKNDSYVFADDVSKEVFYNTTSPTTSNTRNIDIVYDNKAAKDGLIVTKFLSTSTSPSTAVIVGQDPTNDLPLLNNNSKDGAS